MSKISLYKVLNLILSQKLNESSKKKKINKMATLSESEENSYLVVMHTSTKEKECFVLKENVDCVILN